MLKPTPCPLCKTNKRRRPGLYCNPCHVADKRAKRQATSAARVAKTLVPRFARAIPERRRYIVTAAQSNTPVNADFLAALKTCAAHLKAELIVVPYRYKNPTSRVERDDRLWWDPAVTPYLYNQRKRLNPNLQLAADLKINPTDGKPLSRVDAFTGSDSCIVAHPKLQFRTVAVPSGKFPKILTTTGACTRPDYSTTKVGAIGRFHYSLGACLVEVDGKTFHLRQLLGDKRDGSFTDLDKVYSGTGVSKAPPALGLVMGDTHVSITDPGVDRATFGSGGMVETLQPRTLVFHDLFNGETVNPHEDGDLFLTVARARAGRTSIRGELQQMVDFVNARAGKRDVVIVDSNHHDFLRRWVVKTLRSGCHDPGNVDLFLESAAAMLAGARQTGGGSEYADPFPYWMKKLGALANIRCLKADESFKLADIECGMHGHNGPNGSRGSIQALARTGTKSTIGHGHSPGIEEGCHQVGTSTPRKQSYHRGPGSNLNTHEVVYASGKRCLLTVVGDQWRTLS